MSVSIKINSGENRPFALEIEELPAQIHLDKSDKTGASALWSVHSGWALFLRLIWATAVMLAAALAAFFVFAFLRSQRQYVLTFEKDRVLVLEPGLFRDHEWQAYYTNMKGLFSALAQQDQKQTNTTYQIIELQHFEPQKTLPLYVQKTTGKPIK